MENIHERRITWLTIIANVSDYLASFRKHYGFPTCSLVKGIVNNSLETSNKLSPTFTFEGSRVYSVFNSNHKTIADILDMRKEKYQTVVEKEKEEEDRENKAARKKLEKQFCEICRKKFSCQKQYENHLASKAHKKKILEQKDKTVATVSRNKECRTTKNVVGFSKERINANGSFTNQFDSYWPTYPLILNGQYMGVHLFCLFCDEHNQSLKYIIEHMANSHSFVIPDLEYCENPKSLLCHLAQKVYLNFQCIWCYSGKKRKNYNAVRMHMIAKGHCEILYFEYPRFYDYTNYPDDETAEPEELLKVHEANCKLLELPDVYKAKLPLASGKFIVNRALLHKIKQYKRRRPRDNEVAEKQRPRRKNCYRMSISRPPPLEDYGCL